MNEHIDPDRIFRTFNGDRASPGLSALCDELLVRQADSWPEFGRACRSLNTVRSRDVHCNGFSVRLVFNPGRAVNTTAAVNPQDILQRPCFLCHSNLPRQQNGILYRDKYLVLGNPRPAVPSHLTIAYLEHRPQTIIENMEEFLQIATDLGGAWTVLYNGPRCGASAPDHLHFQAIPTGQTPIENDLEDGMTTPLSSHGRTAHSRRAIGLGREVIIIEGNNAGEVVDVFREHTGTMKQATPAGEEPMMNVACSFNADAWRIFLFPRRTHRPAAFYKEGDERIIVSPAVMEMAGVFIIPMERDFDRLDAGTIESIFREVSLADN